MIVFVIISLICIAGMLVWRSSLRYAATRAAEGRTAAGTLPIHDYIVWARGSLRTARSGEERKSARTVFAAWAASHYPGWTAGILAVVGLSFVYQVASGFFFAFFIRRGLFGIPLLVHVMSGGLFAVALSALLVWRGREHRVDEGALPSPQNIVKPAFKKPAESDIRKMLFWAFAFFGLVQATTALGSMLPVFLYGAQAVFLTIHRFGALGLVLTAIVFIDKTFLPARRP